MKNIKKMLIVLMLIIGSIIVISKISRDSNKFNYNDTYKNETKEYSKNIEYSEEVSVNELAKLEEIKGDLESTSFKALLHIIVVLTFSFIFCLIIMFMTSDLIYVILGIFKDKFKENDK